MLGLPTMDEACHPAWYVTAFLTLWTTIATIVVCFVLASVFRPARPDDDLSTPGRLVFGAFFLFGVALATPSSVLGRISCGFASRLALIELVGAGVALAAAPLAALGLLAARLVSSTRELPRRDRAGRIRREFGEAFFDVRLSVTPWLIVLALLGAGGAFWWWAERVDLTWWVRTPAFLVGAFVLMRTFDKLGMVNFGPLSATISSVMSGPAIYLNTHPPRGLVAHGALWVGTSVAGLIANGVRRIEADGQQEGNDASARHALGPAARDRFWLYLRPFTTDGRLPVQESGASPGHANEDGRADYLDLQTILVKALAPIPLVALGRPGTLIEDHGREFFLGLDGLGWTENVDAGIGMVATTEDEWQAIVRRGVADAEQILIVPFAQPGTRWEIEFIIASGALHKTIFIMPQQVGGTTFRTEWAVAAAAYTGLGLHLPPYDRAGALFRLSPGGTVAARYALRAQSGRAFRVRRLLRALRA